MRRSIGPAFAAAGFCSLWLALTPPCPAQGPIQFENISTAEGLSQNTVTSILQDRRGFLWFGTRDGLDRYDGIDFKIYRHMPGRADTIIDSIVLSLLEDRDGKLWVGTEGGGISVFDPATESSVSYSHDPARPDSLSHNQVFCLHEDRRGVVWAGTADGLNAFRRESGTFLRFRADPSDPRSLPDGRINMIYEDRGGTIWIGTPLGLSRFDEAEGGFMTFPYEGPEGTEIDAKGIVCACEDRSGRFWLGTAAGLRLFDPIRKGFVREYRSRRDDPRTLGDDAIRTIVEDRQGRLWIGTQRGGVSILDAERREFTRVSHETGDPGGLKGVDIRAIVEDRGGTIWIGTYIRGVNKFATGKLKFSHILPPQRDPNILDNLLVRSIAKDDDGILWIGTQGGLNRYDRRSGRWAYFGRDPSDPASLSHPYVWAIQRDPAGFLWLGTRGGGLERFDPRTGRSVHYRARAGDPGSLCHDEIRALAEDGRGTLWIGTLNGLSALDPRTGVFRSYFHDPDDPSSLSSSLINAIREGPDGRMWIATDNGLDELDRDGRTFLRQRLDLAGPPSPSDNRISSLWAGRSGELWLSTYGSGIIRFDPATGRAERFGEEDGLANNTVYGILGDPGGMLWMSTNGGISRFDPGSRDFQNFDESDGVQGQEFNSNAYCLAPDGEMFFGGMNGLNAFSPGAIVPNSFVPPVVLTGFEINNVPVVPIPENGSIELSYRNHLLSFSFAALDYQAPEKNEYAYALEEKNPRWMALGTRRSVDVDLRPGRYFFRVKGSNNNGVWNESGTGIRIDLRPVFWQTLWFRILLVLAVLAAAGPLLAWPHKKRALTAMKEARDAAEASNRAKSFFLANMSHELRTPLNAIIGYAEMLEEEAGKEDGGETVGDLRKIKGAGKHLLSLINDILDLSKVEAGKMEFDVEPFELRPLLQEIEATIRPLVEKNGNTFKMNCPETIGSLTSDFIRVRQVLFNLLSNACKFTENGLISLEVGREAGPDGERVLFVVRDTGIGMTAEQMKRLFQAFSQADASTTKKYGGTGLGLAISKRLCEMMGGSIGAESEPGRGTAFTVVLPADGPPRPAAK